MLKIKLLTTCLLFFALSGAVQAATSPLSGRILLQVESKGEAWYVNPLNGKRYFLGRPDDAFAVMRALGLGVSEADFKTWGAKAPARLAGRIVLRTQAKGEAYYIEPQTLKLYFLGRPADAFAVMRTLGLGISNLNLAKIMAEFNLPIVVSPPKAPLTQDSFSWTYHNKRYSLSLTPDSKLYQSYYKAQKYYQYQGKEPPVGWRETYYAMFLKPQSGDQTIATLAEQLKKQASANNLSEDGLVELTMAFVQSIPYDQARADGKAVPNYPYETLYTKLGVCTDKTFVAWNLLNYLGYGVAIMDYAEANHAAIGIECPSQEATESQLYCYAETTNFFPIGFVPRNLDSKGVATVTKDYTAAQFTNIFSTTVLGRAELYRQTRGKQYKGLTALKQKVNQSINLQTSLSNTQKNMNNLEAEVKLKEQAAVNLAEQLKAYEAAGKISEYNNLIPTYNQAITAYNAALADYRSIIDAYNLQANTYNALNKSIYYSGQ